MLKEITQNIYYLKKDLKVLKECPDGRCRYVTIPKGWAVKVSKATGYKDTWLVESLEKKVDEVITTKKLLELLEEGPETMHDDEIYLMRFDSGNRNYEVVGYDLDKMANSLLKIYNDYCFGENYTLKELANDDEEFSFRAFKIKLNVGFDDDEERTLKTYIGDYLDKYRPYNDSYWYNKPYQKWNNK